MKFNTETNFTEEQFTEKPSKNELTIKEKLDKKFHFDSDELNQFIK